MTARSQTERAAVLSALVSVQIFFAVHYVVAKELLEAIDPAAWAAMRAAGASVLLVTMVFVLRRRLPAWPGDWLKLAAFSIFGVMLNQILFVEGLSRTTPTHSAVINTTIPIFTLLFAVLAGREALTRRKGLALVLAFTGVLIVIQPQSDLTSWSSIAIGDLMTAVNAMSFSFFLVISRRTLQRVDPLAATAIIFCTGTVGITLYGAGELAAFDPSAVPANVWWIAAFIVVFPTAGSYLLNYWALARVDSSVVALFIYIQPLLTGALSAWWFAERAGWPVITGGALIFAGVFLALYRPLRGGEQSGNQGV